MTVYVTETRSHNRGFLRSNGVEVSVFAMMAGLGVAMFLALTIVGGDSPTVNSDEAIPQIRREPAVQKSDSPTAEIGGSDAASPRE